MYRSKPLSPTPFQPNTKLRPSGAKEGLTSRPTELVNRWIVGLAKVSAPRWPGPLTLTSSTSRASNTASP
jgi:hypothetical protein